MPCAVGAISTGAPASTATASPCPTPAAERPPATRRPRSCTSPQVCRTGASGSPVIMPLRLLWALSYMVWVNRLTTDPLALTRAARSVSAVNRQSRGPPAHKANLVCGYIGAQARFSGEVRSPPRCFREAGVSTANDVTKPTAGGVNYGAELLPLCAQTETACQVEYFVDLPLVIAVYAPAPAIALASVPRCSPRPQ